MNKLHSNNSNDKGSHSFLRKSYLLPFIFLGLILFLNEPLVWVLNKYWVNPVMSLVKPSVIKDTLLLISLIGIGVYYLQKKKGFVPEIKLAIYSVIISGVYSYCRLSSASPWKFTQLKSIGWISYTDIFFITGLLSLIFLITIRIRSRQNKTLPESIFFNDTPIKPNRDKLGYRNYAIQIAKAINGSQFEQAFAIGITSKWGGGKTSFLDMIRDELNNDLIVIDFNPWRSTTSKAIIKDFFQTVQSHLAPYSSQLNNEITSYANKLLALNDSTLNKTGQLLFSEGNEDSLHDLLDRINGTLKLLNKRIVIFIDDVDRLDKDEVFEVIRLIRNTANFYNSFFIVAYDRSYLLYALKSMGVHHYENFLEKIFQLEITLPYFDKEILINRFVTQLHQILPSYKREEIENVILRSNDGTRITFTEWITTMRDVTRLLNSIQSNIKNITDEIDLVDFVQIEILRFKFPSVYEVLFRESYRFLTLKARNDKIEEKSLVLVTTAIKDGQDGSNKSELEVYLKEHATKLGIPDYAIADIILFVKEIFYRGTRFSYYNNQVIPVTQMSIRHSERFHLYATYDLLPTDFSEKEFLNTLSQSLTTISEQINKWLDDKKEKAIETRFKTLGKEITNWTMYENVIKAVFHFANQKSRIYQDGRVGYDWHDLHNKILPESTLVQRLLGTDENGLYPQTIRSIFQNPDSDHYYEAEFLRHVSKSSWRYPHLKPIMSPQQAEEYLVSYFQKCCEQESTLSHTIWHFYYCCNTTELIRELYPELGNDIHKESRLPEAQKLMIDFISEKDLDTFLNNNVIVNMDDPYKYQIGRVCSMVFHPMEKFEQFLSQQDTNKWKTVEEYRKFHELAKLADGKWVKFDFKILKPTINRR